MCLKVSVQMHTCENIFKYFTSIAFEGNKSRTCNTTLGRGVSAVSAVSAVVGHPGNVGKKNTNRPPFFNNSSPKAYKGTTYFKTALCKLSCAWRLLSLLSLLLLLPLSLLSSFAMLEYLASYVPLSFLILPWLEDSKKNEFFKWTM